MRWLLFTALGGLAFVVLHTTEWINLFHEGYTPWSTPQGMPLFGATFFGITGLHMLHVTIGVIYLLVMAWDTAARSSTRMTSRSAACTGTSWTWSGCSCFP